MDSFQRWVRCEDRTLTPDPLGAVRARLLGDDGSVLQVIGGDLGQDKVQINPPRRRWVDYKTEAFSSERLTAYRPEHPIPL